MKISITNGTYIFIVLSFLSGYFEYIFLLLLIIFIHESGHYIFALIVGVKTIEIKIYPFGGNTIYDTKINISIFKEFICLIGGIIFQLLFYYLIYKLYINGYVETNVYNLFSKINILLISFNFMPIIPLDGGKLINIILDIFFNYKISVYISIFISFIFTIIFLIKYFSFVVIILSIYLFKNIIVEYINIDKKYNNFLLERYLYSFRFKKIKKIKNINGFKRDCYHIINNKFEETLLKNMFDNNV